MPRLELRLVDEAQVDLDNISLFTLLNWGEEQSARYLEIVLGAIENLRDFPDSAPIRPEYGKSVRCKVVEHHRILYRIDGSILRVLRVLNERMDAPRVDLL